MKKIVSKETVAHLFANQSQSEAYTPTRNFYFQNDTLYSYGSHFAIAKHVNGAVLFTTRGYSNTTAKHLSITRHALSHKRLIFCHDPSASVASNMAQFLKEAENVFYNVEKAKQQRTKIKAYSELSNVIAKVANFCEFFKIDVLTQYPKLHAALYSGIDEIAQYKEQAAKLDEAQRKAEQKAAKAKHSEQLKKWRSNEIDTLYVRDGFDYLKVKGQNIRTSQGVEISQTAAKLLYKNLGPNLIGQKVDHKYEITEINDKFLTVGCHKITIKEIKKLATSLGW